MYALNRYDNSGINYNVPSIRRVEGKVDLQKIENSFKELIKRHESLRTQYCVEN